MKGLMMRSGLVRLGGSVLMIALGMSMPAGSRAQDSGQVYPSGGIRRGDGTIMYHTGRAAMAIGIRPGRFGIIELPYGETIVSKALYDPVRWEAPDSAFGTNLGNRVAVVKEKSTRTDISTQLVLLTNGPVGKYVITIHAMPDAPESGTSIGFYTGRNFGNHSEATSDVAAASGPAPDAPCTRRDERLYGEYKKPETGYNPTEVFADGSHECIVMSQGLQQLPVVLNVSESSGQDELINYRFNNNMFVVDGLRRHLVLMLGNNRKEGRVNIVYEGPRPVPTVAPARTTKGQPANAPDPSASSGSVSLSSPPLFKSK